MTKSSLSVYISIQRVEFSQIVKCTLNHLSPSDDLNSFVKPHDRRPDKIVLCLGTNAMSHFKFVKDLTLPSRRVLPSRFSALLFKTALVDSKSDLEQFWF